MTDSHNACSAANVDVLIQRLRAANAGGLREQAYQSLCGDAADELSRRTGDDAQSVRMAAIEECAKIADDFAAYEQTVVDRAHADKALSDTGRKNVVLAAGSRQVAAEQIAYDIRALASQPSPAATVDEKRARWCEANNISYDDPTAGPPVQRCSAGNVDAITTLMIRDMFADHELPVEEAVFHKYEDLARKILIHLRVEPQGVRK